MEAKVDKIIERLTEDEQRKIKDIFELFDKNLDGGIDIKELKFILNCKSLKSSRHIP